MPTQNRILTIDLARGLAVIFMILSHVINQLSTSQLEHETIFGQVIANLGGPPAAPVFMFLMGFSFLLSPPKTQLAGVKRGLGLMVAAYSLNIFRFALPLALATFLQEQGLAPADASLSPYSILDVFLLIDILQFAGLAYILLTLLHRLDTKILLLLIVAVAGVSPFLWGLQVGNSILDRALDFLWGQKGELVAFPLFPWICYPFAGLLAARWYKAIDVKAHFFNGLGALGALLMVIGTFWILTNPEYHLGDYYRTGPAGILAYLGFIGVWLFLLNKLSKWLVDTAIAKTLTFCSVNVNTIYKIQWIAIGWTMFFFGYEQADFWGTIEYMFLMLELSIGGLWLWQNRALVMDHIRQRFSKPQVQKD